MAYDDREKILSEEEMESVTGGAGTWAPAREAAWVGVLGMKAEMPMMKQPGEAAPEAAPYAALRAAEIAGEAGAKK